MQPDSRRVIGAGLWISTILALEQLALDPRRDEITILPVGNPVQISRALEQGEIDGALGGFRSWPEAALMRFRRGDPSSAADRAS